MAYKKLIKVSNVCQVLDKSKYPATQTIYGVTFTNNGDGTITVNGTCTNPYYSAYKIKENLDGIISGHKYAILGTGTNMSVSFSASYQGGYIWKVSNNIFTLPENEYTGSSSQIRVTAGVSVSNITVKPQLFDLTEMYGAGNEPTTVEQFRQDFPEEMYDYNPYCWLTSYKRVFMTGGGNYLTSYQRNLTCKTKNLFDINKAVKVNGVSSLSINGKYLTVSHKADYSNISANVLLDTSLVGKTVTLSAYAKTSDKNTAYLRIQWLSSTGLASTALIKSNNVSGQTYQKVTLTGVVPEQPDDEYNRLCLSFYSNGTNVPLPSKLYTVVYTDIQLELGDTATDYVPYGHL